MIARAFRKASRGAAATIAAALVLLAAAGAGGAPPRSDRLAHAEAASREAGLRQSARLSFSTRRARSPAGTLLEIDWRNPADPSAKPHAVARFAITLHRGTRFAADAVPRCDATDPELILAGASACPGASRVGGGELVTDSGSTAVIPRFTENTLTSFNGDNELITLAESSEPPTRVVGRARIEGRTITTEVPTFPGAPPPDPYLAFKHFELESGPITGESGPYLRTPKCPKRGYWTNRLLFTYRDGVAERVTSRSPCRPRRSGQ